MHDVVIMTDSCCDLPEQLVEKLGLTVVPLSVHVGEETYPDLPGGRAISYEKFYDLLHHGAMPTTAAVNIGQYEEAMRGLAAAGKDIVCVCFSSALSTTYQSACIAADTIREEYLDVEIHVIDSLCASLGQGLLLYLAAKKRDEGFSATQLAAWVEAHRLKVCHWFTVDDLLHLRRGGRVSAASAIAGTVLGIKPIMHMSEEGKLAAVGKVRGRRNSLNTLIEEVSKRIENAQSQTMFLCHADCLAEAEQVAKQLKERLGVRDVIINYIGPVIGSHTGCNTMGLFFLGQPR